MRREGMLELRHAFRSLWKNPGAALVAFLALGLGIGANTAVYSCAYGMLQHPFSFPDFQQLTVINEVNRQNPGDLLLVAGGNYRDWQSDRTSFTDLREWAWYNGTLTGGGPSLAIQGCAIEAGYFDLLGIRPVLGRTFAPDENRLGREREVILSNALWKERYGASPQVLGQTIELDNQAYSIVGVMGTDAVMPAQAQLWVPLAQDDATAASRTNRSLHVMARLRNGVSMAAADAELNARYRALGQQYPASNSDITVRLRSLSEWVNGNQTAQYIYMLLITVAFVLLIACANVANLQFARALGRSHELAVRAALGAARWRIVRQLLLESVLLGAGGAVVGLVFGWYSIHLIQANMPAEMAVNIGGWDQIRMNFTVFAFTLAIALAAGVIAGLIPAWSASRPDLNLQLREGARGTSGGRRHRLRAALVVAQMTLATVLLAGAGLMVRGFSRLASGQQVYRPESVLTLGLALPAVDAYKTPLGREQFYSQVLQRIGALPGVAHAALATQLPLTGNFTMAAYSVAGRPAPSGHPRTAISQVVSPEFFPMLNVSLLQGRLLNNSDGPQSQPVVLVSRQLAKQLWPAGDAVGHQIKLGGSEQTTAATDPQGRQFPHPWMTIVGVVGDVPYDPSTGTPQPAFYMAMTQSADTSTTLLLQGPGDPNRWAGGTRAAIAAVDPNQPVSEAGTLAEMIHRQNIGIAYVAVMMGVAGFLALVLAAIGIYALMLNAARERQFEFGVRLAMGARPDQLAGLIFGRGGRLLGIGILLGLPLAWLAAQPLASLSYGVSANDPLTYAATVLLLIVAAAVACLVPSWRASRVDPLIALRAN